MSNLAQLKQFLATGEPANLGPEPRQGVHPRAQLEEQLKAPLRASSLPAERQELIRALILLWHDHLDSAHEIAQKVEGPDGAFVHGIMHRREPDFGNAAYWFRRVGLHPAFTQIASEVAALLSKHPNSQLAAKLVPGGTWNPFGFIDACAAASKSSTTSHTLLREVQKIEFSALLDFLLNTRA